METKACSKCGVVKSLDEFGKYSSHPSGKRCECKECVRKASKERYYRNHEKISKQRKECYQKDLEKSRMRERASSVRHAEKRAERARNLKKTNPEKNYAHRTLNEIIRLGKIKRPLSCPACGASDVTIHAHHEDYSKPLDVVWLCPQCHKDLHKIKKMSEVRWPLSRKKADVAHGRFAS